MKYLLMILAISLGLMQPTPHAGQISTSEPLDRLAVLAHDQQLPLILIFTSDGCGYCARLKRELLLPMLQRGEFNGRVLLREFNINQGGKITDFDGERVRSRIFISRYKVFATPTLVLLNAHGQELRPPLVGYNQADRYLEQLNEALRQAQSLLAISHAPGLADKTEHPDHYSSAP